MAGRADRPKSIYSLGGGIALLVLVGAGLWVEADSGTKQAELGGGLVSTGMFGLLLLLFEQVLSAQTREVDRKVSLAAAPEPSVDQSSEAARRAAPDDVDGMAPEPSTAHSSEADVPATPGATDTEPPQDGASPPRHFRAKVREWMRDTSRIDADQLPVVVECDDRYFQFFTAIVPGAAFRRAIHGSGSDGITLAQLRRATADLAVGEIRQSIGTGQAPRADDPSKAIELFPNVEQAVRRSRNQRDEEHTEGEIVAEWSQ